MQTKAKLSSASLGHKPWNKGLKGAYHLSLETRQKMSKSKMGHYGWTKGIPLTEEHKKKISIANTGKIFSKEHNEKIRLAKIGTKRSEETKMKMSIMRKGKYLGEESSRWKGDNVGYGALHDWVKRRLDCPKICSQCEDLNAKKYEWHNVSGNYKRDLSDWTRLCNRCHKIIDGRQA